MDEFHAVHRFKDSRGGNMFKKAFLIVFLISMSLLTGCSTDNDYEEEIVIVDQPKEDP
jgi:hypothetical protein